MGPTRPSPTPLVQEITWNSFSTTVFNTSSSSSSFPKISPPSRIVYFIPGNPGLIAYYHLFLSLLAKNLQPDVDSSSNLKNKETRNGARATSGSPSFVIYGRSLGGFEVEDGAAPTPPPQLYSLREQIGFVERSLHNCVHRWQQQQSVNADNTRLTNKAQVILVAHSVGSYIAMEVIKRWLERDPEQRRDMEIVGGILLFPTVVDIAKSRSGKKFTILLSFIPYLATVVSMLTKMILLFLPNSLLYHIVSTVMGYPKENAVCTTMALLRSKTGVQQGIHMGADEMREISADTWTDEVWGISRRNKPSETTSKPLARLVFYFGRDDHWVAEQTRDDIIRARGATEDGDERRPRMVVCDDGVLHGFCIGHNDIMAWKTARFIQDIVEEQGQDQETATR